MFTRAAALILTLGLVVGAFSGVAAATPAHVTTTEDLQAAAQELDGLSSGGGPTGAQQSLRAREAAAQLDAATSAGGPTAAQRSRVDARASAGGSMSLGALLAMVGGLLVKSMGSR